MRQIKLMIVLLLSAISVSAQQDTAAIRQRLIDSVKSVYIDEAAWLYPVLRQFSITHQQNGIGGIKSKKYGDDFFKGRMSSARTTMNMNFPVLNRNKHSLILNLGVVHQFFGIREITNYDPQNQVIDMDTYIPMINAGLSYSRRDTILGRQISFNIAANGLFDPPFSRTQFTFRGLISTPVIRKKNTNLIVGLVILGDPASPTPAFLFMSYFHKFQSLGLDLMVDLPYRAALRKSLTPKMSLSVFSELGGNNSFFEFKDDQIKPNASLPQKLTFSTLEIKSGVLFEYRMTKKMVFSLSGGVNSIITSKIFEQGEKPSNYFIKNKNNPVPFIQVGVSLLPFWKGLNL